MNALKKSDRLLGARYLVLISLLLFVFTQAIACGAGLYEVPLEGDTTVSSTGSGTPTYPVGHVNYGIFATGGWIGLPINYTFGSQVSAEQKAQIESAMKTWEWAIGLPGGLFQRISSGELKSGDSFEHLNHSLEDDDSGQYLVFDWEAVTGKQQKTLATTVWSMNQQDQIDAGDILYNSKYYTFGDGFTLSDSDGKMVIDLESLALHELGHLLGLLHVDGGVDGHSVMLGRVRTGAFVKRVLTRGDIERIQKIYGCYGSSCDVESILDERDQRLMSF